jgi:hypothetical protein
MTLPLNIPIDVEVQVAAAGAASPTFDLGLAIGTETVIPTVGANARVRLYSTSALSQMLTDGYLTTDLTYIAAQLYASQQPTARYFLAGRQNLTAIGTAAPTASNGGTGYVVGDVVGVNHSGAAGGFLRVQSIGTNGVVTAVAPIIGQQGNAYVVSTANTTTGGSGTGLEVDILTIGETPLQAAIACRAANSDWYIFGSTVAVKADHIALTEWAQTAQPQVQYFFSTADSDVLAGLSTSVGGVLKGLSQNRFQGCYKTTQSGTYPNDPLIWAAAMGMAMGRNTGLAGSYFNLPFKSLTGIAVEPLSVSQVTNINSQAMSVYINYNNTYPSYTPAMTGSGQYFDQILGLDMLASDIQYGLANLLASVPAVPITDAGMTTLLNAVNAACELSAARGFIAGGIWAGPKVLNLQPGGSVPNGYLAQCDKVANQVAGDRALRKAMPIYVTIILAEAVQSITIGVFVQP